MSLRKLFSGRVCLLVAAMMPVTAAADAVTRGYGADEYITISNGASPDGRLAIATHGEGVEGHDHFHVYLFDAASGKKIGPLEEISEPIDTVADAFLARWRKDSTEATIIYRTSRRAPLQAMTYRFAKGRATPLTRQPVAVRDQALAQLWQEHQPPGQTFGTPKQRP